MEKPNNVFLEYPTFDEPGYILLSEGIETSQVYSVRKKEADQFIIAAESGHHAAKKGDLEVLDMNLETMIDLYVKFASDGLFLRGMGKFIRFHVIVGSINYFDPNKKFPEEWNLQEARIREFGDKYGVSTFEHK